MPTTKLAPSSLFFVDPGVETRNVAQTLSAAMRSERRDGRCGRYFDGVIKVDPFLSDEGRQHLEGQIFAYGADLRDVCRTVASRFCPDELTVPAAEQQIPVIGHFANEFEAFVASISDLTLKRSAYQLRVYDPKYGGHPEHVDYAPGFTFSKKTASQTYLTSLSFSLPISWNDGVAPRFELRNGSEVFDQETPGSLIIFGPRILHAHPAAPDLASPYAWLIVESFLEGSSIEDGAN